MDELIRSLRILSLPSDEQVKYLENAFREFANFSLDKNTNVDEIGLQFEDSISSLPNLLTGGVVDKSAYDAVMSLSHQMEEKSKKGYARLWTVEYLINDPWWDDVREKAKECLLLLESRIQV